jgi:hypothetical protein
MPSLTDTYNEAVALSATSRFARREALFLKPSQYDYVRATVAHGGEVVTAISRTVSAR